MNERFLFFSLILFFVILISEYLTYASLHHIGLIKSSQSQNILMILGIAFPVIFIVSLLYSYKNYSLFASWANTISSIWLIVVFYIFIISIFVFILIITNTYLNTNIPIKQIASIFIIITFIAVSYGIWNSNNPRIVRMEINSSQLGKEWSGKKIVIISDVHLGNIHRVQFMQKIVDKIKPENPDITFNLGDLIDGSSFPYQKWLNPLLSLNPQMGNYYVEGNHEKYNQEYNLFKSEFPQNLNDVTDKKIILNNTQIIGLSYRENESKEETKERLHYLGYDKTLPSIVLIHNPMNTDALSESGVSLVLSGHTHGGQIFPLTLLVNKIYKEYAHGITYINNTFSITSYGVGTAISPVRITTNPEIIVLTIK